MGLRDIAASDVIEIINDTETGGDEITITSPAGVSETFNALTNDIHFAIDPETGETVTGRQCSATVLSSDLVTAGFTDIKGIPDTNSRPWVVQMTDINGVTASFKVVESHPDNTIGLMILILGEYSS
jgi:hypothetical protein